MCKCTNIHVKYTYTCMQIYMYVDMNLYTYHSSLSFAKKQRSFDLSICNALQRTAKHSSKMQNTAKHRICTPGLFLRVTNTNRLFVTLKNNPSMRPHHPNTHTHTHIHTHTHTYTHTHTHTSVMILHTLAVLRRYISVLRRYRVLVRKYRALWRR